MPTMDSQPPRSRVNVLRPSLRRPLLATEKTTKRFNGLSQAALSMGGQLDEDKPTEHEDYHLGLSPFKPSGSQKQSDQLAQQSKRNNAKAHGPICQVIKKLQSLFEKLQALDVAYFYQLALIREIKSSVTNKEIKAVRLADLSCLHPMTGAKPSQLAERVETLQWHQEEILSLGRLDEKLQDRLIPSKAPMSVVEDAKGRYILFDGNGRLKAIQTAFAEVQDLNIDVLHYKTDSEKVKVLLEKIQKMRGL